MRARIQKIGLFEPIAGSSADGSYAWRRDFEAGRRIPGGPAQWPIGTGQTSVTNRANDVEWYFNNDWSWGFAAVGDEVNRISRDVRNEKAEQRLCWHTDNGFLDGGFRCGATTGLNGSTEWERVMYQRNS